MKTSVSLIVLLLAVSSGFAQRQRPIPPGVRQADQAEAQFEKDSTGSPSPSTASDPIKLRNDAAELARLAQSVPSDIDQTTKGMLPKDLSEKLKQIEVLAKQLRKQISR